MEVLEALAAQACHLENPHMDAEKHQQQQQEEEDRASHVSSGRRSDNEEPDPSTSPPAAKRRKKEALDLSDVPMNLPPIPSNRPDSSSQFKGVSKSGKKWVAKIQIPSEGGTVHLGIFHSEEEAGIMYARARYKYPAEERDYLRRNHAR